MTSECSIVAYSPIMFARNQWRNSEISDFVRLTCPGFKRFVLLLVSFRYKLFHNWHDLKITTCNPSYSKLELHKCREILYDVWQGTFRHMISGPFAAYMKKSKIFLFIICLFENYGKTRPSHLHGIDSLVCHIWHDDLVLPFWNSQLMYVLYAVLHPVVITLRWNHIWGQGV